MERVGLERMLYFRRGMLGERTGQISKKSKIFLNQIRRAGHLSKTFKTFQNIRSLAQVHRSYPCKETYVLLDSCNFPLSYRSFSRPSSPIPSRVAWRWAGKSVQGSSGRLFTPALQEIRYCCALPRSPSPPHFPPLQPPPPPPHRLFCFVCVLLYTSRLAPGAMHKKSLPPPPLLSPSTCETTLTILSVHPTPNVTRYLQCCGIAYIHSVHALCIGLTGSPAPIGGLSRSQHQ
jgi:hypothetical protein